MSFSLPNKSVLGLATASTTNGATATALFDTLGFNTCTINVNMTTADSTTNKLTTLKISESDDTVVTNFVDITAFVGGTNTGNFTLPAPSTTTNQPNLYKFNIDLRGRKRYLKVTATPPTTQSITVWADLHKPQQSPVTAAAAGAVAVVEG